MARPLRINRAGLWYHVTARGINRHTVFHEEAEWRHWRELLPEFVHRFRLKLHAYVMMSNHYHLLVEAPEANLSLAMQWLQTLRQLGELSAGIDYATVSAGLQRIKRRLSTDRSLARKAMAIEKQLT